MTAKDSNEEIPFTDAMRDLEQILREIEEDEVDIDALGARLKRAAELLELCRAKIRKAEVEVGQIVDQMQTADAESTDVD